jgi:hypothetical protein
VPKFIDIGDKISRRSILSLRDFGGHIAFIFEL